MANMPICEIAVKCINCGEYFDSEAHADSKAAFDAMQFYDCLTRCHHCKKLTPLKKELMSYIGSKTS